MKANLLKFYYFILDLTQQIKLAEAKLKTVNNTKCDSNQNLFDKSVISNSINSSKSKTDEIPTQIEDIGQNIHDMETQLELLQNLTYRLESSFTEIKTKHYKFINERSAIPNIHNLPTPPRSNIYEMPTQLNSDFETFDSFKSSNNIYAPKPKVTTSIDVYNMPTQLNSHTETSLKYSKIPDPRENFNKVKTEDINVKLTSFVGNSLDDSDIHMKTTQLDSSIENSKRSNNCSNIYDQTTQIDSNMDADIHDLPTQLDSSFANNNRSNNLSPFEAFNMTRPNNTIDVLEKSTQIDSNSDIDIMLTQFDSSGSELNNNENDKSTQFEVPEVNSEEDHSIIPIEYEEPQPQNVSEDIFESESDTSFKQSPNVAKPSVMEQIMDDTNLNIALLDLSIEKSEDNTNYSQVAGIRRSTRVKKTPAKYGKKSLSPIKKVSNILRCKKNSRRK